MNKLASLFTCAALSTGVCCAVLSSCWNRLSKMMPCVPDNFVSVYGQRSVPSCWTAPCVPALHEGALCQS